MKKSLRMAKGHGPFEAVNAIGWEHRHVYPGKATTMPDRHWTGGTELLSGHGRAVNLSGEFPIESDPSEKRPSRKGEWDEGVQSAAVNK